MWRVTRAWPSLFVVLVLASGCGGGSPTSPSWGPPLVIRDCDIATRGAMTATLDGTPWIPVSTWVHLGSNIALTASDCASSLEINLGYRGLGTYDVAAGDVRAALRCDGRDCGLAWVAQKETDVFGVTTVKGGGSVTVTAYRAQAGVSGSGAIEGTFSFTLLPHGPVGATGPPRGMTNGRFAANF